MTCLDSDLGDYFSCQRKLPYSYSLHLLIFTCQYYINIIFKMVVVFQLFLITYISSQKYGECL